MIRPIGSHQTETLYGVESTRAIERASQTGLPPHALMARAGASVASLTRALAPHARRIWIACGPGNNGGDGLIAAMHLHRHAVATGGVQRIVVTLCGEPTQRPPDAANALAQALAAGVAIAEEPPPDFDFAIDALLGIGKLCTPEGRLANHMLMLQRSASTVLCVDMPSGLHADTGVQWQGPLSQRRLGARHTLALLTLKPGLFTGDGRDQAGQVWFDDLGVMVPSGTQALARLNGMSLDTQRGTMRAHAGHKGIQGDVMVIGGQDIAINGAGMTGAAILAARAALYSGAGRVYVGLLAGEVDSHPTAWDPACPELMFRDLPSLLQADALAQASVVCGCGGGSTIATVLPAVLKGARALVLDADAINVIATDTSLQTLLRHRSERGMVTAITPHPLEAARLLGCSTATVMADRLAAVREMCDRFAAVCVLKGSGTVIGAPGLIPGINPTGNAKLATAGTGDVLAGMVGSALAGPLLEPNNLLPRVSAAVYQHGWLADRWVQDAHHSEPQTHTLTAGRLAQSISALH